MGLLDRFLGSDKNLRGPDFEKAPWLELDFSGTKLRFKDPQHTAMYPINVFAENLDLFDASNYKRQKEGDLIKTFYTKGWALTGKERRGGVDVIGRIFYFDNKIESGLNCFKKTQLKSEALEFCHLSWGWQNKGSSLGVLGNGVYVYPTKNEDLQYVEFNNTQWCNFSAKAKGCPPDIEYLSALSQHHLLAISFTLGAYHAVDFFNPATNLEQASYKLVDDFMRNFYIELSPEAKAQKAAAEDSI